MIDREQAIEAGCKATLGRGTSGETVAVIVDAILALPDVPVTNGRPSKVYEAEAEAGRLYPVVEAAREADQYLDEHKYLEAHQALRSALAALDVEQ